MSKRFLSALEAAERLSVSRPTVYKLCHAGELAYTLVGGSYKFTPEDLEAYLARQYRGVSAAKPAVSAEHSPGQSSPGDGGEGEATVSSPPSAP